MNRIPTSAETMEDCRNEAAKGMLEPFRKISERNKQVIMNAVATLIWSGSDKVKEVTTAKVNNLVSLKIVAEATLTKAEGYNLGIGLLARIKNRIDYPIVDDDIGVSENCYVIEILVIKGRWFRCEKVETFLIGMKRPEQKRIIWE